MRCALALSMLSLAACSNPPPGPTPCDVTADCASLELCREDVCVPRPDTCCLLDSDCPDDFECVECLCQTLCFDRDGDSFVAGPRCLSALEPDCNDSSAAIAPGLPEVCLDGIDQNCVDGPDEFSMCSECATAGARECGAGRCRGLQDCDRGGFWSTCIPILPPEPEQCGNDIDDDCNGIVDDC